MVHGCAKRGAVSHHFERIRHWNAADILWKVLSHRKSTKQRRHRFHLAWFYCSLPLHCNVIRYFVNSCKNRFSLEIWPNSSSLPIRTLLVYRLSSFFINICSHEECFTSNNKCLEYPNACICSHEEFVTSNNKCLEYPNACKSDERIFQSFEICKIA